MAEVVEITWANEGYANSDDITLVEKDDVTLNFAKGSSNNPPKYYTTGAGFRMYSGNTLTVSVPATCKIESIEMTAAGTNYVFKATADTGTVSTSGVVTTWNADAAEETTEVVFSTSSTSRIQKTVITYSLSSSSNLELAEMSFPQAEYKVAYPGPFTAPELTKATDAVAVYSSSNEAVATVAADGAVTIVAPGTTVITATCDATDKYAKGSAKYTLVVYKAAQSIADMLKLAAEDKNAEFMVEFPMTVTYANDRYVYVNDNEGGHTLIYFATGTNAYSEGDVLAAGWMTKYSEYQTLPEFVPVDVPTVSGKSDVTFRTVFLDGIEEDMVNEIVFIEHVVITEETPDTRSAFSVAYDGGEITFYNQFTLASQAVGTYKVKAAVSKNKGNVQVYPIAYDLSTGVADVETVAGVAKYFDLNGRQVMQPINGMYVKVVDGKASKVIVR